MDLLRVEKMRRKKRTRIANVIVFREHLIKQPPAITACDQAAGYET